MPHMPKLSVPVGPELSALLNEAVAAGDYPSPREIVAEALRDWCLRREERRLASEVLGRLWDEGLSSGGAESAASAFATLRTQLPPRAAARARR